MTPLPEFDNPREKLVAVVQWLNWQCENLSFGLKTPEDALKLYDYWFSHSDLPECADIIEDDEGRLITLFRIDALGYDPLNQQSLIEDIAERRYYDECNDDMPGNDWEQELKSVKDVYIEEVTKELKIAYGIPL